MAPHQPFRREGNRKVRASVGRETLERGSSVTEKCCTTCAAVGPPERHTRGSFLVEFALWLLFFAPGLIYAKWRLKTAYDRCPACGSTSVVPLTSRAASDVLQLRASLSA